MSDKTSTQFKSIYLDLASLG
eukprot:COSAG05_NODE_26794_length_181_cov_1.328571_1_plen_20_part_10